MLEDTNSLDGAQIILKVSVYGLQRENVLLKMQHNERQAKPERKGISHVKKGLNDSFELEQKQTVEKTTQTDVGKNFQVRSSITLKI